MAIIRSQLIFGLLKMKGFRCEIPRILRLYDTLKQCKRDIHQLKDVLRYKILEKQKRVRELCKEYGGVKVCDVTINQVYSGMRGVTGLLYETSVLDARQGVLFRGHSVDEINKVLPRLQGGSEPLPEGIFWLMLTGEVPTNEQVLSLSEEWTRRSALPNHIITMLHNFPKYMNPLAQFSCAITALHTESHFIKGLSEDISKDLYWEYCYEDCMDLLAKLPVVVASVYRIALKDCQMDICIDEKLDWTGNLCRLMGFQPNTALSNFLRLYLTLHSDHEGGSAPAHTVQLVGSTLCDPYLALSAGINSLAGHLGMANQKALVFVKKLVEKIGSLPTDADVEKYVKGQVESGRVIPGFGHPILNQTDPRYLTQREFAYKYMPHDHLFKVVNQLSRVVPPLLIQRGEQNPWPNVDSNTGVLLTHFGFTEMNFYPVLLGLSRALGTLASLIWARALNLPVERPKSLSTDDYEREVKIKSTPEDKKNLKEESK